MFKIFNTDGADWLVFTVCPTSQPNYSFMQLGNALGHNFLNIKTRILYKAVHQMRYISPFKKLEFHSGYAVTITKSSTCDIVTSGLYVCITHSTFCLPPQAVWSRVSPGISMLSCNVSASKSHNASVSIFKVLLTCGPMLNIQGLIVLVMFCQF